VKSKLAQRLGKAITPVTSCLRSGNDTTYRPLMSETVQLTVSQSLVNQLTVLFGTGSELSGRYHDDSGKLSRARVWLHEPWLRDFYQKIYHSVAHEWTCCQSHVLVPLSIPKLLQKWAGILRGHHAETRKLFFQTPLGIWLLERHLFGPINVDLPGKAKNTSFPSENTSDMSSSAICVWRGWNTFQAHSW